MESFCVGVLKSHRFPLRTCRWIYLHQGKRREDRNNCAIFILFQNLSVQTLILLNLVSWNGLHRSNVCNTPWATITFEWKRSCFGSPWISCCPSQRFQEIHLSLYTYMQPIIIIMYIFSKWISSNRIEYNIYWWYSMDLFSLHIDMNTRHLCRTIKTSTLDKTSCWSLW